MRMLIGMILVLILVGYSIAEEFPVGYVNSDGYSYVGNGVWTYNGGSYTRQLYTTQTCGSWRCGNYYPGIYQNSYQYSHYIVPQNKKEELPAYTDPQWKTKLLDIAANRDKIEGEIRKGSYEHAAYLQSIQALGLTGNFRWQGYGTVPPYAVPGQNPLLGSPKQMPYSYELTNYGATANTQYGYSYNTIASIYGDTNLNALYQQAGQLVQQSQKLSGEANSSFQGLVGQEGTNRAKIAEILARGQMAQQVLQALQSPGESKGFSFKFSSGGKMERTEEGMTPELEKSYLGRFNQVSTARCASCHSGKVLKGNFDIASYIDRPEDEKQKIWELLTTDDDKKRMPRNADGSAGRLTPDELKAFIMVKGKK